MNQSANHPSIHPSISNIHFHLFPQLNPAELTKTFSRLTELTLSCTKIPEAIFLLKSLAKNSSLTRWHNLTERWWMLTKSRQHWLGVSLSCPSQAHNQLLSQLQLRLRPVHWLLLHTNRIAGKKTLPCFLSSLNILQVRAFANLSQLHLIRVELNTLQLVPLFEAIAKGNYEEVTLSAMDLSQVVSF